MRKNSIDDIEQDCEAGIIKDRKIWQKFYPGGNMRLEKNRQDQMTPAERITSAGEGKMVDRVIIIPFMGELKCYLSGIRSRICILSCWETGWIRKSRNLVFNLLTSAASHDLKETIILIYCFLQGLRGRFPS